jgi:hypothetical protein
MLSRRLALIYITSHVRAIDSVNDYLIKAKLYIAVKWMPKIVMEFPQMTNRNRN